MKNERGITLIALIITIIVLLVLTGVTLSAIIGENGILSQTAKSKNENEISSEKEAIELMVADIKTSLMTGEEIAEERYVGEKLSKRDLANPNWKNVTVGDTVYKDGWYIVEKGKSEIDNYGIAKQNWVVNYTTGEVINLVDGNYAILEGGKGIAVAENLPLNISPDNMENETSWGDGVEFIGDDGSGNSGWNKSEIKFDGIDDYLKIDTNIDTSLGITFEFYGKAYEKGAYLLCKNYFDGDNIKRATPTIRTVLTYNTLRCTFGSASLDCGSDYRENDTYNKHWLQFTEIKANPDYNYISISLDFSTCELKVYDKGEREPVIVTSCSKEYLDSGDLFNNDIPFCVGLCVEGTAEDGLPGINFRKFDLYACRLYNRVLSGEEINQNYLETTAYHNQLVEE